MLIGTGQVKKLVNDFSIDFSKVLPIEDGEIIVSLTKGRPSAKELWNSPALQDWLLATNIRLRLIQTKTMLGHLMSVAQGDKTVTRRVCFITIFNSIFRWLMSWQLHPLFQKLPSGLSGYLCEEL